jgi:hypothetical protein
MHRIVEILLVSGLLLTAACAQQGAAPRVGSTKPLDCAPFIDADTALAKELAAHPDQASCETRYGPQGGYVEAFGSTSIGARDPASKIHDRGLIMVYRYFGWDEALAPINGSDLDWDRDFRILVTDLPVQLEHVDGTGRVVRFETVREDVTRVCVSANTRNPNGSRSLIDLCRPIGNLASDEDVMAEARLIATQDFPAINP